MTLEEIKGIVRNVPDFPIKGILFRDLTTTFARYDCLEWYNTQLVEHYQNLGITKVVGIESRGFIIAPMVARNLNAGFVPIRKPGKLPAEVIEESYAKEYGVDKIQIHKDAVNADDVILLHDDLLATGGTMAAAIKLLKKCGVKKIYVNFLVELDDLKGKELLKEAEEVYSLIHY